VAKVTVVGAGNVGGQVAARVARSGLVDEIALVDVIPGLADGIALDIAQCAPIDGFTARVTGSTDYGPTEYSDVVVVTSGRPRQPGQSRLDLLAMNAEIVSDVVGKVVSRSPYCVLILVTNPLDEMTYLAWRVSGLPHERVLGMAGTLDSSRFRTFLAWELGVPASEVDALTLGSHGDTMVPVTSLSTVGGKPLAELVPAERLERIARRTRDGGAEIVGLLKRGSAFHAPGASVAVMVSSIVRDEHRMHPACAWLTGEFGISEVFLGVPAVLGRRGVERIEELPLGDTELAALREAGEKVGERCRDLDRVLER
jgi:malate dehydrogenase